MYHNPTGVVTSVLLPLLRMVPKGREGGLLHGMLRYLQNLLLCTPSSYAIALCIKRLWEFALGNRKNRTQVSSVSMFAATDTFSLFLCNVFAN